MLSATDKPNFFIIGKLTFNSWTIYRRCKNTGIKGNRETNKHQEETFHWDETSLVKDVPKKLQNQSFLWLHVDLTSFPEFFLWQKCHWWIQNLVQKMFDIWQAEESARKCQQSKPKCLGMTPETLIFIALKCVLSLLIVRFPFYNKSFMSNFIYWWLIRNTYAIF